MSGNPQPAPKSAPGKSCGTCTLCCKLMGVRALDKPFGRWCPHCKPGVGCGIYDDRPRECRTFMCLWLTDAKLGPEWKPEKSKIILTMASNLNGLEIRCDPAFPDAWRRAPFHRQIVQWAQVAGARHGTVAVWVGNRVTMVTPDGELPLGKVLDDEEIVSDFSGDRLVRARVVKAGEA